MNHPADSFMGIFGFRRVASVKDNVITPVFTIECAVCGESHRSDDVPFNCETGDGELPLNLKSSLTAWRITRPTPSRSGWRKPCRVLLEALEALGRQGLGAMRKHFTALGVNVPDAA